MSSSSTSEMRKKTDLVKAVHIELPDERAKVGVLEESGQQFLSEAVCGRDYLWVGAVDISMRLVGVEEGCGGAPKNESPSSLHRMRSSVDSSATMLWEAWGEYSSGVGTRERPPVSESAVFTPGLRAESVPVEFVEESGYGPLGYAVRALLD